MSSGPEWPFDGTTLGHIQKCSDLGIGERDSGLSRLAGKSNQFVVTVRILAHSCSHLKNRAQDAPLGRYSLWSQALGYLRVDPGLKSREP